MIKMVSWLTLWHHTLTKWVYFQFTTNVITWGGCRSAGRAGRPVIGRSLVQILAPGKAELHVEVSLSEILLISERVRVTRRWCKLSRSNPFFSFIYRHNNNSFDNWSMNMNDIKSIITAKVGTITFHLRITFISITTLKIQLQLLKD